MTTRMSGLSESLVSIRVAKHMLGLGDSSSLKLAAVPPCYRRVRAVHPSYLLVKPVLRSSSK